MCFINRHLLLPGSEILVRQKIPQNGKKSKSALIHRQVALKFGKIHDFDMPSYRQMEEVEKLVGNSLGTSHAHVSNFFNHLRGEILNQSIINRKNL